MTSHNIHPELDKVLKPTKLIRKTLFNKYSHHTENIYQNLPRVEKINIIIIPTVNIIILPKVNIIILPKVSIFCW